MGMRLARVWGLTAALAGILVSPLLAADPPNVILIIGDDQAWNDYSFLRQPGVEEEAIVNTPRILPGIPPIYPVALTPAIDRLANNGLTFIQGYTTPLCRPSLASVITGTHPHQNLVLGNRFESGPDDEVELRMQAMQTLPRILGKSLGYQSFQTGKWWEDDYANGGFTHGDTRNSESTAVKPSQWLGNAPSYVEARQGDWGLMAGRVDYVNTVTNPEHWDDVNEVRINYSNTVLPITDWIDAQHAAGEPFFVWYAPYLPHTPHDPPPKLKSKYDAILAGIGVSSSAQAKYFANIERLDGGVEAILDHLDNLDITDNTVIIYYHDNGWINKDGSSAQTERSKRSPYEGGIRTPIIVHWPEKIKTGGEIEPQFIRNPVSTTDIAPTILAAVGLEPSPEMLGINLMDLNAVGERDTLFCEDNARFLEGWPDPAQTLETLIVFRDGWKLLDFEGGGVELYQLYDTNGDPVDPHEMNDLSGTEAAKVTELQTALNDWYDTPKSMEWGTEQAQGTASNTFVLKSDVGQTFTPSTDQFLAGIRVGLKPLSTPQEIMLELRQLDAGGAPLGTVLASATLPSSQLVVDELRWYRFAFLNPVSLGGGTPVGFRLVSDAGTGSLEVAYLNTNSYSGGDMYFPGTLEGNSWTSAGYDLTFESLTTNYPQPPVLEISPASDPATATLGGNLSVKDVAVILQHSTDLTSWADLATDSNSDGRVHWNRSLLENREFFRMGYGSAGELITVDAPPVLPSSYSEDFDGIGLSINGRTIGDSAWVGPASSVIRDNGSVATGSDGCAYIPFAPVDGFVYTLSAEFQQPAPTSRSGWIAFGFLKATPTTTEFSNNAIIWALNRNLSSDDNQVLHEDVAGGAGSVARGDFRASAGPVSMSIVLDTTGGSGNWKYDWIVDGVAREDERSLGIGFESAIGSIGIGTRSPPAGLSFESFELTVE
jgi:uncharacterized sulfatase